MANHSEVDRRASRIVARQFVAEYQDSDPQPRFLARDFLKRIRGAVLTPGLIRENIEGYWPLMEQKYKDEVYNILVKAV